MDDDMNNPIDDELMRELGLEPAPKPKAPAAPKPAAPAVPDARPAKAKEEAPAPRAPAAAPKQPAAEAPKTGRGLTQNMPIQVVAVLGKKTMALKEVANLKQGEILDLQKNPQDGVDLVANGKLIARGELVMIDGKLGIQVRQLVG